MKLLKLILPLVLLAMLTGAYFLVGQSGTKEQVSDVKTTVKGGDFIVKVFATGELQAKRSEKVRGPQGMRSVQIWQTTISDIVAEGTVVEEGDYIATLDRTELEGKMKEVLTEIEKIETQLDQTRIDTAIEMRQIRDELINLKFAKEEKLLQVEQNKYEPQSVIQQTEIDLQKTQREYTQLTKKYELTKIKTQAKVAETLASLKQNQLRLDRMQEVRNQMVVTAPKAGMVIYARSWEGKKGPGSRISSYDPVVAELPDLSEMISKTFVNEVDISKVRPGQDVNIKVDAFPDKEYLGQVVKVANIGEQLKGYDSKVFEVMINLITNDSILRPAMTTGIEIVTDIYQEATFIPLEALFRDSVTFVYREDSKGRVFKQEVITGAFNENEVKIDFGLEPGETVFLNTPDNADKLEFAAVPPEAKEKVLADQRADAKAREAVKQQKMKEAAREKIASQESGGGGIIIID